MYDGEIRIDTRIDTTGLDKGVNEVQGKLNRSVKGLQSLMKSAGLAAAFAALAKGVKQVAESTEALENSIRKASTLFSDVAVNVDNLRGKILQLSSSTGIAAEKIGGALYEALSSGVPATEDMAIAMDFLRSSAEAAKGGFADLEGTVTATAAVINAYGLAWEDAERVQGVLIQTQNKGMTTIGQLSNGLARVIPTAASFGVSLEQIGAALATTTAAGTQTDEAITGLNSLLAELGKQGQTGAKGLTEAAKAAGLGEKNFQDLIDEGWTIADILTLMSEYADKTDKTLIDMFGSIEAGRTALQLAGENAGRFADNLEAMNNTEGLVAAASAAVTTNTERLSAAIRNAGSTIGSVFEPAVQDVAGQLADMVNAMFGNRDEAGRLETALGNVKIALENYKKAQEDAKGATDDTTTAMLEQSEAAFVGSLADLGAELAAAEATMERNTSKISKQNNIIEEMDGYLDDLARQAHMTREEMDRLGKAGILDKRFLSDWQMYNGQLETAKDKVDTLSGGYANLSEQMDSAMQQAAEMYAAGYEQVIEGLSATNAEASNTVVRLARAYSEGTVKAAEYGEITLLNMEASAEYIKTLEDELDEVEIGSTRYSFLKAQIDALTKAYNELAVATGKPRLDGSGGTPDPKTPEGQGTAAAVTIPVRLDIKETPEDVIKELNETMMDNSRLASIMGESFDLAEADIAAMTEALKTLVTEFNLDASNESVQNLIDSLELLGVSFKDSTEDARDWKEKLSDWCKELSEELAVWGMQAATSFTQSIGTGIEDLVVDLMTIDEQVAALNEELGDAQAEQLERNQELAEAEEEYRLALLEGNQSEIDAALASLEAAEDSKKAQDEKVKSLKDEIKATQDGTKAWESFGKAALLALADVLEGLGAQLAAQAVAQAVDYNLVNAAIATAGSVAAYVAAGLVRGWAGSYAEGGIVPQVAGVPSTGDQHVARVNPGELILNEAQQENLASLLAAQKAMLAYRESEGDKSPRQIVVELNGDVYGLDSEEVGRAVYRNIRSLQEEGRLDRWR